MLGRRVAAGSGGHADGGVVVREEGSTQVQFSDGVAMDIKALVGNAEDEGVCRETFKAQRRWRPKKRLTRVVISTV